MKKMKYTLSTARIAMLAILILGCATRVAAQQTFVITNGDNHWQERLGSDWYEDPRGVMDGTWAAFHKAVPNPDEVHILNRKGQFYMMLDLTDPANPRIDTTSTINPFCVWIRTGRTGYYYQEHTFAGITYQYYLLGSSSGGLRVNRVAQNQTLDNTTYWYDWDNGLAVQEEVVNNGWTSSRYYWVMLDSTSFTWRMTYASCYERPETRIYENASGSLWRYYDNIVVSEINHARGKGGLFMPVTKEYTNKTVVMPADKGLTDLSASASEVPYQGTTVLTPTITISPSGESASVVDGYYTYREEVLRQHISENWEEHDEDIEGRAGVPTIETHYFWDSDPAVRKATVPTAQPQTVQLSDLAKVEYTFPSKAMRYIDTVRGADNVLTVTCRLLPRTDMEVTVTATDYYNVNTIGGGSSSGTPQLAAGNSRTITFTLKAGASRTPVTQVDAPVIGGDVFGGGRMANVDGNTNVTIHNCDSIRTVFGGNDIAGTVTGGSTVTIGTDSATTATGIYLRSVYGGGNGYYKYEGIDTVDESHTTFNGQVRPFGTADTTGTPVISTVFTDGIIPEIGTTHVVINNDLAHVDSVFGGAKNAFITGDGAGVVTVDQNAGVVYAEFGGNNFGGAITGTGAVTTVNVNGTKTKTDAVVLNGHDSGFGYDFGIRYLFGGGNLVDAVRVQLNVLGGMVDTCFAGGNNATVTEATTCVVNTTAEGKIFNNPKGELTGDAWVGGTGIYNVRNLFAGNNNATMNIMPTMTLVRGGLGNVYGGGNRGDMAYDSTLNTTLFPVRIDPATDDINLPSKIGTYVIVNGDSLDIDYLYGGCRMSNVLTSTYVNVNAGNVGTVFGGCNISGDVGTTNYYLYGDRDTIFGTYVVISGSANIRANVFAGANGNYHCNTNKTAGVNSFAYTDALQFGDADGNPFDPYDDYVGLYIPTHNNTNLIIKGGTIQGNAYGGANLANVGFKELKYIRRDNTAGTDNQVACPRQHGSVHLTMTGGTVKGNMFGGGNMASIYGLSYLIVQDSSIIEGSLYAGNDRVGTVEAFGAYIGRNGSTDADFLASDGTPLNGLSGMEYNALFDTYVLLKGTPAIGAVYGSGNGAYNYDGTRTWYPEIQLCEQGSIKPPIQSSTFIDINTEGLNPAVAGDANKHIDTVFGGGNGVSVEKSVHILLNCVNNTDYYVGTIFGGNNRDDMKTCVPQIDLKTGKVRSVYGGGNAGSMGDPEANKVMQDICDNDVHNVATHIVVNSTNAAIDTIYGGCNVADVNGMAYIDIRETSTDGIGWVYGGNNISGSVTGNTRIDVNGGRVNNIYGGSNGFYDYKAVSGNGYTAYQFGHLNNDAYIVATGTSGVPNVAYALINIFGGTINNNVYGGGRMGDCDSTRVVVNDRYAQDNCGAPADSATINGVIYGGGEGIWWNLDSTRRGNVKLATNVELHHASALTGAKAYGGGRGGNVYRNAYLTVFDEWDIPFNEIYGGCWGSDLYGTAHLTLNGSNNPGDTVARRVFGGNDFTGNVTACELNINSGNYNKVYGAGNGDSTYVYDTGAYYGNPLPVPNAETVVINFNGGNVRENIYGGGCLGTTMKYILEDNGEYRLVNNRRVPDTTYGYQLDGNGDYVYTTQLDERGNLIQRKVRVPSQTKDDATDFSYIIVNFHDGTVNNIYTGGEGKDKLTVYGLKILNMDGGMVSESVYGGSERVDDGYPSECDSVGYSLRKQGPSNFTHTTMRPSSIVNIVGGTVTTSVYGGGYLGDAYGSTYVNIGQAAVDSCPVWTDSYTAFGGTDSAYWKFKPGVARGYSAAQTPSNIYLELSIYGGANWGSNVGSSFFNKPGIFGGKTILKIDGNGYNTGNPAHTTLPKMNIKQSVIGSGTSALAGDVLTSIDIRNYGFISDACESTKDILSVQRADELWLRNTAINYSGTTDAVSAYPSQNYTINRIDTVNACGYNVINLEALMTNLEVLNFYKDSYYNYRRPTASDFVDHQTLFPEDNTRCGSPSLCTQFQAVNPTSRKFTAVAIRNGVNIDVIKDGSNEYGIVQGFAYLMAESQTNALVTAHSKSPYVGDPVVGHVSDGGFTHTCPTENKVLASEASSAWELHWDEAADDDERRANSEYPYENYSSTYRVWSIGSGRRSRYAVILAHTNYEKLDDDKQLRTTTLVGHDTEDSLALAHVSLKLPSTQPGHYYRFAEGDVITITEQNSNMTMVEESWIPICWDTLPEKTDSNVNSLGQAITLAGAGRTTKDVLANPGTTFGLSMACGENFSSTPGAGGFASPGKTVITGSNHFSVTSDFVTYKVSDMSNTSPVLDFYMTYNHDFSTTILGTVKFTLDEFDENDSNLHSPINVVLTVATIIDTFKDMNLEVLAMYNEGRSNYFTRKAVFPATLQHQNLYLKKVTWQPTDPNGIPLDPASDTLDLFYLTGSEDVVTATPDSNTFCLAIQPVNNVSADLTSNIGWHVITQRNMVDLHGLIKTSNTTRDDVSAGTVGSVTPGTILHPTDERGLKLGELDGRGLAALNIQLTFDGNKVYRKEPVGTKGYVGLVSLELESVNPSGADTFRVNIFVKCREKGDTIYMASADSVTRGGKTLRFTLANEEGIDAGKRPEKYINSIEPLKYIYKEGDVIAIIDTLKFTDGGGMIQGSDYIPIPIVRYSGHHDEFPGKECAYRGPMIEICPTEGKTATLTASCVNFIGSSVCKSKNGAEPNRSVPDTLIAHAPIFSIHGKGATLNLQNAVTVEENYNDYVGNDYTLRGAISVTDSAVLNLVNSVKIFNNITKYNAVDDHRDNGAVYVNTGLVKLLESHQESKMEIHNNFLMPETPFAYTKQILKDGTGALIRYAFDTTNFTLPAVADTLRGNVFLTRVEPTTGDALYKETHDVISYVMSKGVRTPTDVLVFDNRIPANTIIGITKWLPGTDTRDTIMVTYQNTGNFTYSDLAAAKNFVADEPKYTIFYSDLVDDDNIFLHQCATFRHQIAASGNYLLDGTTLQTEALQYRELVSATCPKGGDTIIYNVMGGLFPYTYTWSGAQNKTRTTMNNKHINEQINLATPDYTYYLDAVSDTLLTNQVSMALTETTKDLSYIARAKDVAGCNLSKFIDIHLEKITSGTPVSFEKTGTLANWVNEDTAVTATGDREFKAINITPQVWADRDAGTVEARIANGGQIMVDDIELSTLNFCEGDVIVLTTSPTNPEHKFIMWDFDPYYSQTTRYVVPSASTTVTAYYGPNSYWIDHINTTAKAGLLYDDNFTYNYASRPTVTGYTSNDGTSGAGIVNTYNGDLHIYDENGLAWLISSINGFNGTQARTFHFNRVYLHEKSGGYDMKDYLWTPMGTLQHPFEGMLVGVGATTIDTTGVAPVVIKNIIVDEPNLDNAGFFAVIDSARIINIELQGAMIRGSQNVGTLAAQSSHSRINRVNVMSDAEDTAWVSSSNPPTTILTTHHTSGGMIGLSDHDTIVKSKIFAKFVGDAVYSGGGVGYGTSTIVQEVMGRNDNRMRGLYIGGMAGYLDGVAPRKGGIFRPKSAGEPSVVQNNYFFVQTENGNRRMGGVAGYAENSIIANNYVYGNIYGSEATGGVVAVANDGTEADHNYYESTAAKLPTGVVRGSAVVDEYSAFEGQGNRVMLEEPVYGVNNLTRVLNKWVREQNAAGGNFQTWRSDLANRNNGYPVFGQPDTIPVDVNIDVEGCEEVEWNGTYYTADVTLSSNVIDPVEMIDSTTTINIHVHHGTVTNISDSAIVSEGYEGYGFSVSATEAMLLNETIRQYGSAQMVLTDTFSTVFGCDSVVTLTLTFTAGLDIPEVEVIPTTTVKVYPNPTVDFVNVETEGMVHVELYDNEGRTMADYDAHGNNTLRINVSHLSTGIYYLRVHSATAVTIQKIVKR